MFKSPIVIYKNTSFIAHVHTKNGQKILYFCVSYLYPKDPNQSKVTGQRNIACYILKQKHVYDFNF